MPEDWKRYALVKSYMACLDDGIPANVENVSAYFEARAPQMCDEVTTSQVAEFIQVEKNGR